VPRVKTPAQVEGVDFFLLHEGPKLFWRMNATIDILIYHHIKADCVEVIGFDPDRLKELNRIYLSLSAVKSITELEAKTKVEAVKEERELYSYRGPSQTDEEIYEQLKNLGIVTHIVDRIHLIDSRDQTTQSSFTLQYVPLKSMLTSTSSGPSPVLLGCPEDVKTVCVTRRRHTNMDDVNKVFDEVLFLILNAWLFNKNIHTYIIYMIELLTKNHILSPYRIAKDNVSGQSYSRRSENRRP
jgi:hypothetical protein